MISIPTRVALGASALSLLIAFASSPKAASHDPGFAASLLKAMPKVAASVTATGATFGGSCTIDADCASGACSQGKQESFCSLRCRRDADCPSPPSKGACNGRGYCKR